MLVNAGSAYLFDTVTGNLLQTINNPGLQPNSDAFGSSVSITDLTVLIGAPGKASGSGIAYIYQVPEPLTLLGASTAIAFGTAFKRRQNSKNKDK